MIRGIDNTKLKRINLNLEVLKSTEALENKIQNKNTSILIKKQAIKILLNKDTSYIDENVFNRIIIYSDLQRAVNTIKKCYYNININNPDSFEEREPILGDIWFRIKNKKTLEYIALFFAITWSICVILTPPLLNYHEEINGVLSRLNILFLQIFVIIIYSPLLCIAYHAAKRFQEIEAIEWLNKNKPQETKQILNNIENSDSKHIEEIIHSVKPSFLEKIKNIFRFK